MFRSTIVLILFSVPVVSFADDFGFYIGGSLGYSLLNEKESDLFAAQGPVPFGRFDFTRSPVVATGDVRLAIPDAIPILLLPSLFIRTSLVTNTDVDVDDEDLGWKVYGGYHFNKYFGIEIGYADLGEVEADINSTSSISFSTFGGGTTSITSDININATSEVTGFLFAGLGRYPLTEKIDVFGKIGGFAWNVDTTTNITSQTTISPLLITTAINPISSSSLSKDDGINLMFGVGADYRFNERIGIRAEWERYSSISADDNDVDLFSIGINYHFDIK